MIAFAAGVVALLNPFGTTLLVEQLTGWMFIFGGIAQIVMVFGNPSLRGKIWAGLFGLALLFLGTSLLGHPLAGIIALTAMIAIMFAVSGVAKILFANASRGEPFFWPMLISGALSVVLAAWVLLDFPAAAAQLIGIMLAVELLSTGVFMMASGLAQRSARG